MGRVVFVTGASRGIGAAVVERFVKEGWRVVGFYNDNKLEDTEKVSYVRMDISDSTSIELAFEKAIELTGGIDVLVNCAGIFGYKKLGDYELDLMDKLIAVNEKGTYLTTKAALKYMTSGAMVHVSSTVAQVGSGSDPIYAGTKGAVVAFVKSMAKALAPEIRVNCVAPGATDTHMIRRHDPARVATLVEQTPMKKLAQPADIADGIYFLASDQAKHITGATLDISGGYVMR